MAEPGTLTTLATELAMALAAVAAVPKEVIRLRTSSLPIWNMPFSRPLGMLIPRMRFTVSQWNSKWSTPSMWTGWAGLRIMAMKMTAATTREARVPMPAPAAPMSKP